MQPSFWLLVIILAAFEWMGMTYYIRGEFYREKAKDYVAAAIVTGVSEAGSHVPPYPAERADSGRVVRSVHYRGEHQRAGRAGLSGLRAACADTELGRADWARDGNLTKWWLVFFPLGALFTTLLLVVFIGEAVREAFDPKEYSRLAMTTHPVAPESAASGLISSPNLASPRPSTASISTSCRARCSVSSANPVPARASPR